MLVFDTESYVDWDRNVYGEDYDSDHFKMKGFSKVAHLFVM